jgi:hypothetical protein
MDGEDPGLLGGLPRERPGKRSDKRSHGGSGPRSGRPAKRSGPATERPGPPGPGSEEDRPGGPVHGAGRIAGAGLRAAGGLTRGVLRRLPRP